MEDISDNQNKEQDRRSRSSARIESMRREKRLQMRRRRMIRRCLRLTAAGLGVVIILIFAITVMTGKPKVSEAQLPIGTEGQGDLAEGKVYTEGQKDLTQILSDTEEQVGFVKLLKSKGEEVLADEASRKGMRETSQYRFESTADTLAIYSEEVISSNAILIDESTDTIIAAKGERERISPASMTKVLTVLVAAEHITEEELSDTFTMTAEIVDYGFIHDCYEVGFLDKEKVTVRDLFFGTVLHSGSDAALGLAAYVAGSHEAFVELMNEKLEELGLSDSAHVTNCVGIYDDNHYCTVYDMGVIMKAALQNELCREVLSARTYTTEPTKEHPEGIDISNWFLRRIEDKDTGGMVLSAKTGYVVQSGNCAVSYGTFADGRPYICVTSGSSSSWRCIYDHVEIYNQYVLT